MSHFYVKRSNGLIDEFTDAQTLAQRVPRYDDRFDAIKDVKLISEDMFTYTTYGRQHRAPGHRRVASIPDVVLTQILELEPDFLANKSKFYAWLDKHPEYATIRRR